MPVSRLYGPVSLLQPIGTTMVLTPATRHLGLQVSPFISRHLPDVAPPTTLCTPASLYSISISMRHVVASPCRAIALSAASRLMSHRSGNGITRHFQRTGQVPDFATNEQARRVTPPNRVRHPAHRQFTASCSPPRLAATQLLSATGSWLALTRTFTVLMSRLHGRTHSRVGGNLGFSRGCGCSWIPACAGMTNPAMTY